MDNSMDILSLISGIGNDPAALGALSELMKSFGSGGSRPSPSDDTAQAADFGRFTASSQPSASTSNVSDGNGGGISPELIGALLSTLGGAKTQNSRRDDRRLGDGGCSPCGTSLPPCDKNESENRVRLLNALRPYLNEERRCKIDLILKLLKIAELGKLSGILNSI